MYIRRFFFISLLALAPLALCASQQVPLSLSDCRLMTLSFPSAVKYVDFGSQDIKGLRTSHKNILCLKADIPVFDSTTASVVTADGAYYSFSLFYDGDPKLLGVDMSRVRGSRVPDEAVFPVREVGVSDIMTTHMVFSSKVTDILTGSDSIIADYADGIDNIVRVKAVSRDFPPSSLTVVTDSGMVYPFLVSFDASPEVVNFSFPDSVSRASAPSRAVFSDHSINEAEMESLGRRVVAGGELVNTVGAFTQDMVFAMSALYIKDDILMFRFDLENDSRIDYEVDFLKMYITDRKRGKKTALQEDEIKPVYVYSPSGDEPVIRGRETRSYVLFFRRFTIPEGRVLHIEAFERNGGRHIGFTISNKEILRARLME